jgi:hypothetical protein
MNKNPYKQGRAVGPSKRHKSFEKSEKSFNDVFSDKNHVKRSDTEYKSKYSRVTGKLIAKTKKA